MGIKEKEDKLFERWVSTLTKDEGFVKDGVVNEGVYVTSNPKILFVLKEMNAPNEDHDLRTFLGSGRGGRTWNNVARWTKIIQDCYAGHKVTPWASLKNVNVHNNKAIFSHVAALNLKKIPGGGQAVPEEIEQRANLDKGFLQEQFSLYGSTITICGGTYDLFNKNIHLDNEQNLETSRGIKYRIFGSNSDQVVIDFRHPCVISIKPQYFAYALFDAIAEIRDKHKI